MVILIAGIGYRNLRDLSVGPLLVDRLQQDDWPPGIDVKDLSYSPITMLHDFDDWPPYDRVILLAGVRRDRQPGGVYCYPWEHQRADTAEVQARVAEALMGVISLDNLLIIATYFGKLPRDVVVIEVEAADAGWGEGFTIAVEKALPQVLEAIWQYVR